MFEIEKTYKDGFGIEHHLVGFIRGSQEIAYSDKNGVAWFRLSDGQRMCGFYKSPEMVNSDGKYNLVHTPSELGGYG